MELSGSSHPSVLPLARGTPSRRWDLGLAIGLDSEALSDPTQIAWLESQLARHDGQPTLVMRHRARFSSGENGDQADTDVHWDVIKDDPDVRLVLWGDDHDHERMAVPVTGRAPLTAMVIGTGGSSTSTTPAGSRTCACPRTHTRGTSSTRGQIQDSGPQTLTSAPLRSATSPLPSRTDPARTRQASPDHGDHAGAFAGSSPRWRCHSRTVNHVRAMSNRVSPINQAVGSRMIIRIW